MLTLRAVAFLSLISTVACGDRTTPGRASGGAPPGGARPPSPVEMVLLAAKAVEQTSEFVGTIKSRRSTSIQPQVEGFITRIAVKSGDLVRAGALLVEIDSKPQDAAIAALESVKAQREIDVAYARQEADRARRLLDAGAASQMDADRAANALKAAHAQVRTVEEQIRQSRTELAYYRVTAPTSGTIGDVPVREGDRVTKSTLLTTVDSNEGLELYLNVPIQQAPQLRTGLPVRLLDDAGREIAKVGINFVSPSVDTGTQTVLAKVPINTRGTPERKLGPTTGGERGLTNGQFVRAQLIWTTAPALTVPVTAVTRINGQFFVFVAEKNTQAGPAGGAGQAGASNGTGRPGGGGRAGETTGPGEPGGQSGPGQMVARQRAVMLGNVLSNEYVVLGGLKEGDMLIVSGVQKIGDGAPVASIPPAQDARPEGRAYGPAQERR